MGVKLVADPRVFRGLNPSSLGPTSNFHAPYTSFLHYLLAPLCDRRQKYSKLLIAIRYILHLMGDSSHYCIYFYTRLISGHIMFVGESGQPLPRERNPGSAPENSRDSIIPRGISQVQPTESSTELLMSRKFHIKKHSNYNFKLKNITPAPAPTQISHAPNSTILSTFPQPF